MRRPRHRLLLAAAFTALALTLAASHAHAQADARQSPAYFRGRTAPADPEDAALWIPRVLFFPLHVVSEYLLRRPLVALANVAEEHHVEAYVSRVFAPTPDFAWSPSFTFDFAFAPMLGANLTWNNALVRNNRVRFMGLTGGAEFLDLALSDTVTLGWFSVGVVGRYFDRPDRLFYGLGPTSELSAGSRYRLRRRDVFAVFGWHPSFHFGLDFEAGYRQELTGPGIQDPTDPANYQATGGFPAFDIPLELVVGTLGVVIDSRHEVLNRGGVRLELGGTYGLDTLNVARQFVVASALLEGAVEVLRPGRVLVASLHAADSHALSTEPVPLPYLPQLGRALHPGFRQGRFVGQSAVVAEVDYHYPIWFHLDALWMFSVGNAFGEHFAGFDPRLLTTSFGLGVRTRFERAAPFEAILAFGTSRFDEPFGIESVRVYLGVNRGL